MQFLEEIPGDTDEGHPAVDNCTICGKVCEPTYREPVGEFPVGRAAYEYYCKTCGEAVRQLTIRDDIGRIPEDEIVKIKARRTHTTVTFTEGRYACSCPNPFNKVYPFRMQPIDRKIV